MFGIRDVLLSQERGDYSEHLSGGNFKLDCSMGSNPYGTPPVKFSDELLSEIAVYPEYGPELVDLVHDRFKNIIDIKPDMVAFSTGSVCTCLACNRMCLEKGKTAIVMAPTFTAITDDMFTYEPNFVTVTLNPNNNYKFEVEDVLDAIQSNPGAYVYIDNPNNPTGQVFPLDEVEQMVAAAREANSFIVMDEAYGDYMEDEVSAINLVPKYENLLVVRTLSKAYGIAGMRVGYAIAQPSVMQPFHMVNVPYSETTLSHAAAVQVMQQNWGPKTFARVKQDKPKIIDTLAQCKNLKIAETNAGVPISMIYVEDSELDLEQFFAKHGLRVVTCSGYTSLSKNAIRMNLHDDIDTLIALIKEIDSSL